MRLYSLKESPIFQRLSQAQQLNRLKHNNNLKLRAIFCPTELLITAMTEEKCILTVASLDKIRTIRVILEKAVLYAIILKKDGIIGYINYSQIMKKIEIFESNKMIISSKDVKELTQLNQIKLNKNENASIIAQFQEKLYYLEYNANQMLIVQVNKHLFLNWHKNTKISDSRQSIIKQIVIDDNYKGNQGENLCFLIVISHQGGWEEVILCEIYYLGAIMKHSIAKYKILQPKGKIIFCKMKADYAVTYFNSLISIVEFSENKWSLLAQVVPYGMVLEMFQCGHLLITQQKCKLHYSLLKYNLNALITFRSVGPILLVIKQKFEPIFLIKNYLKHVIILYGLQTFLIAKSIFRITSTINDCQPSDEIQHQDTCQNIRRTISFQQFKLNDLMIKQLEIISKISSGVKKLNETFRSLGVSDIQKVIDQLIYQYLSAFIYLTSYAISKSCNSFLLLISNNLPTLLQEVTTICKNRQYECFAAKIQVLGKFDFKEMSKIVHNMMVIAKYTFGMSQKKNSQDIFGLKLPEVLFGLYHQSFLVEYISFKLIKSHYQDNQICYTQSKQILHDLLQPLNDYHPLVYLIISKPFAYTQNRFHLNKIHEIMIKQIQQTEERINFLKQEFVNPQTYQRYNNLMNLKALSLPSENNYSDENVIYLRTNFEVNIQGFEYFYASVSKEKSQSQWKLPKELTRLDYKDKTYIELGQAQLIKILNERQRQNIWQLIGGKFDDDITNFSHQIAMANIRVIKIMQLKHKQLQKKRIYNIKLIDKISKLNLSQVFNKRVKCQSIRFEPPVLFDALLRNYLKLLARIGQKYRLSFMATLIQRLDIVEMSRIIQEDQLNLSEIEQKDECIFYDNYIESQDEQYQKLCLEQNWQTLWDLYISMIKLQEHQFEVFQYIRQDIFAEILIQFSSKISCDLSNNIKQRSPLSKPISKSLILQLSNKRSHYRIKINQDNDNIIRLLWIKLISFCQSFGLRWLGDPFDLLQQLISNAYLISQSSLNQQVNQTISALFAIQCKHP